MSYATLVTRTEGAIHSITINREERRNALSPEVVGELNAAFDAAGADPSVRAIVLTGAGTKAFSSGGDLGGMAGDGFASAHAARGQFADLLRRMNRLGKPTLARVNGQCLAGGFGLMLACDLAIACESATFGTPEVKVGLFPMMIMAQIRRHLTPKQMHELMLFGERMAPQQALAMGLINRVVPDGELDTATSEWAHRLAAMPAAVVALGKRAINASYDMTYEQALDFLHGMLTLNTMTEDVMEGVAAFLEKRTPEWKHR